MTINKSIKLLLSITFIMLSFLLSSLYVHAKPIERNMKYVVISGTVGQGTIYGNINEIGKGPDSIKEIEKEHSQSFRIVQETKTMRIEYEYGRTRAFKKNPDTEEIGELLWERKNKGIYLINHYDPESSVKPMLRELLEYAKDGKPEQYANIITDGNYKLTTITKDEYIIIDAKGKGKSVGVSYTLNPGYIAVITGEPLIDIEMSMQITGRYPEVADNPTSLLLLNNNSKVPFKYTQGYTGNIMELNIPLLPNYDAQRYGHRSGFSGEGKYIDIVDLKKQQTPFICYNPQKALSESNELINNYYPVKIKVPQTVKVTILKYTQNEKGIREKPIENKGDLSGDKDWKGDNKSQDNHGKLIDDIDPKHQEKGQRENGTGFFDSFLDKITRPIKNFFEKVLSSFEWAYNIVKELLSVLPKFISWLPREITDAYITVFLIGCLVLIFKFFRG